MSRQSFSSYRYHWINRQTIQTATQTQSVTSGQLFCAGPPPLCALGDAPDLPSRPHWQPKIEKFAQNIAVLQLKAAKAGISLAQLLHQTYPRWTVPPRGRVYLQATCDVASCEDDKFLEQLSRLDIQTLKVKVTNATTPAALQNALQILKGRGVRVRIDANGSWAGRRDLQVMLRLCADFAVEYIEDPTPLADLPLDCPVAFAADVIDSDAKSVLAAVRAGRIQVVVCKPALWGSPLAALQFAQRVAKAGAAVVVSSLFDGPAGLHALAQIASVMCGANRAHGVATHLQWPFEVDSLSRQLHNIAAPLLPRTLPALSPLLQQAANQVPHTPALFWQDKAWTFNELQIEADRFATGLAARGVGHGDRVAVWAHNAPELIALLHGVLQIGAIWLPLHPRATPQEVASIAQRAKPRLQLADLAHQMPDWPELRAFLLAPLVHRPVAAPQRLCDPEDIAAIVYTSGTSGQPKGAMLSHRALRAAAAVTARTLGSRADDRWLCALPLCHVSGLAIALRAALSQVPLVLATQDQLADLNRLAADRSATLLSLVPSQLRALLDRGGAPAASIRCVLLGGAPACADLVAAARAIGWPVLPTYGLTETCGQVATAPIELALSAPSADSTSGVCVGPALAGNKIRISGGEIAVRSPTLFSGYLDDDASTKKALRNGWLYTGDLGSIDAKGRLWVSARRSDLIVRNGENVYPAEIEALLLSTPGVADAAVFALADVATGQAVAAWIVVGADADEEKLKNTLNQLMLQLSPFKRPQHWWLTRQAMPRTGPDKLARSLLPSVWQVAKQAKEN